MICNKAATVLMQYRSLASQGKGEQLAMAYHEHFFQHSLSPAIVLLLQLGIIESRLLGHKEIVPSYETFAFMAPPYIPVFSRRREIVAGRLAMLGFFVCSLQEVGH